MNKVLKWLVRGKNVGTFRYRDDGSAGLIAETILKALVDGPQKQRQ